MALFTALSAIAAVGGAVSAHKQQKSAEADAKRQAKKQETKAKEALMLRAPTEQELRTKIGVSDAAGTTNDNKRGSAVRQGDTGLGGLAVSAAQIGGL